MTFLVHAGLFGYWFHNPPNSDMDYRIFSVHMQLFCMYIYIWEEFFVLFLF